jgi:serine protease AprX
MNICGKKSVWRRLRAAALATSLVAVFAAVSAGATWGGTYDPSGDPYSMYNITLGTGAQAWWNAGYTGKGIDVALIDTGVAPVAGLNTAGKVINGPDLSLDSQSPSLRYLDAFGHGTFMAGLIAGKDPGLTAPYSGAPPSTYRGMAPDARIISLKVGATDGEVDVSQVIAAIDWVVQHAHDPGLNIRVLNLSYGTNSLQGYDSDPLAYAVEQAWKAGIVVVAAAGNSGFQKYQTAPGLADPAFDPFVLAVGGVDTMGTSTSSDDSVGDYSANAAACNTTCRGPDVMAPGTHIQGLRVPNSYIDVNHPEGYIDSRYFRGSGTSQATAITSGAVALVLQKYPTMTPDQVKAFFDANADNMPGYNKRISGNGELDLGKMLTTQPPTYYLQTFPPGTGLGSLENTRGSDHLSRNGVILQGEEDIFGNPFGSAKMAALEAAASSWSGGTWNGSTWSGSNWQSNNWLASTWSASSWSGSGWTSSTWSGSTWSANTWSGSSWSSSTWSGSTWSGSTWSGSTWSGGSWQGATWD